MLDLMRSLTSAIRSFGRERRGSTSLIFGLALPTVVIVVSAAVDYSNLSAQTTRLRSVSDSAALAAAREVRLGTTNLATIQNIAQAYVYSLVPPERLLGPPVVTASIGDDRQTVTVGVSQTVGSLMGVHVLPVPDSVNVSSTARIMSGAPICMIGLDDGRSSASLKSSDQARLTASGCAIYSNARGTAGLTAADGSYMNVALACSGGGVAGAPNFSTTPKLDCPQLPDPLAARPNIDSKGCNYYVANISSGTARLNPGVYCGGLKIWGTAKVDLNPGTFVIRGGPLSVKDKAILNGTDAGIYLADDDAVIRFEDQATIDLSGPTSGQMAGLLFQEKHRTNDDDDLKKHRIATPNAKRLLGTIYLPRGILQVETSSSIAASSAFTIIVAARVAMDAQSNLVLNTGYASTNVPVPDGVGPANGSILLDK